MEERIDLIKNRAMLASSVWGVILHRPSMSSDDLLEHMKVAARRVVDDFDALDKADQDLVIAIAAGGWCDCRSGFSRVAPRFGQKIICERTARALWEAGYDLRKEWEKTGLSRSS